MVSMQERIKAMYVVTGCGLQAEHDMITWGAEDECSMAIKKQVLKVKQELKKLNELCDKEGAKLKLSPSKIIFPHNDW